MEQEKCKTCKFYKANSGARALIDPESPLGIGLCRLKPPVMVLNDETHVSQSRWPCMHEDDSCGEWEPREVEPREVEPRKGEKKIGFNSKRIEGN